MRALVAYLVVSTLSLFSPATIGDEFSQSTDLHDSARTAGLAYTKKISGRCNVSFFDPEKVLSRTLADVSDCPELLFASMAPETIYFVVNGHLHFVHLFDSSGKLYQLTLPDDDFESYRDALEVKPIDEYFPPRSTNRLSPTLAGTLDDGRIAVVMSIDMPADDQYSYLFVRNNNQWQLEDQKWCGRFEYPCSFDSLKSEISYYYEMQNKRTVWSQTPADNEFLNFVNSRNPLNEFGHPIAERELMFNVNGVSSLVTARGNYGQDTGRISTYSMRIVVDGRELRSFSVATCGASSFDQFFLVHPCFSAGGGQLLDLETGEILIDSLMQVVWVN